MNRVAGILSATGVLIYLLAARYRACIIFGGLSALHFARSAH
jgi:hypothetical protein